MNAAEINTHYNSIISEIQDALVDIFVRTNSVCSKNGKQAQEPDFIALFSIDFTKRLFDILAFFYKNNCYNVTSIFCHQSPYIHMIDTDESCEIGDILFIYKYTNNSNTMGKDLYNSLLFQAKMFDDQKPIKPDNAVQLKLYAKWPRFKYRHNESKGIRDIQPKTITDGAQYLLIEKDPSQCRIKEYHYNKQPYGWRLAELYDQSPVWSAIPSETLYQNTMFGTEIINFIKFKSGRMFDTTKPTDDEWSKTIYDILDLTREKVFNRRNSNLIKKDRTTIKQSESHICLYGCKSIRNPFSFNFLDIDGIDNDGIYGFEEDASDEKESKGFLLFVVDCVSE
jgi:hypothetical protein